MTTLELLEFDCELIGEKNLCLRHTSIEKIKLRVFSSQDYDGKAEAIIYDLKNLTHSFLTNAEVRLRKYFYEMMKIYNNKVEEML